VLIECLWELTETAEAEMKVLMIAAQLSFASKGHSREVVEAQGLSAVVEPWSEQCCRQSCWSEAVLTMDVLTKLLAWKGPSQSSPTSLCRVCRALLDIESAARDTKTAL